MRTIRRLYFYAVAFVSLEIVVWGLVGLARSFFCIRGVAVCGAATFLAQGLALILVGVPVFGFHWWMAERLARQDGEEHASGIRAVFLYGALLGTLIPVVQNTLALLDRLALQAVGLSSSRAILGSNQSWSDNLIAIVMNAIVAVYFLRVLQSDWLVIVPKEAFTEIRRIYRHVWLIYSLGIVVAAVQQLLRFVLDIFPGSLSFQYRASGAHGLALVLAGLPLWFFAWKTVQNALTARTEREVTPASGGALPAFVGRSCDRAHLRRGGGGCVPSLCFRRIDDFFRVRSEIGRASIHWNSAGRRVGLLWTLVGPRHG